MIFGVLAVGAFMGTITAMAGPVRRLRAATDTLAGVKKGEVKIPIRLELFLSKEQFEHLLKDREVELAFLQMSALKRVGQVPTCKGCGGVCV